MLTPMSSTHIQRRSGVRRILLLLSFACVLALAAWAYVSFWMLRPTGSGPAGPRVPHAAFQQSWSDRPALLVGLGDSVTAGFGARKGHSYFELVATNAPDDDADMREICLSAVIPKLQATNLALSGSTSAQHAGKQLLRLPATDTQTLAIVVITTGGNDLIHNYGKTPPREQAMYGATWAQAQPWITNFERRLETMLDQVTHRFPGGCEISLANIYDPTDGLGDADAAGLPPWPDAMRMLAAYNDIIQRAAARRKNVHLVNLHEAFLGHGIHCRQFWRKFYRTEDPHYWYHENLEDPNERGYDALRRLFLNEMAKQAERLR
jgi:lysophospholipase L1-like esterase